MDTRLANETEEDNVSFVKVTEMQVIIGVLFIT